MGNLQRRLEIKGTGSYLPEEIVGNEKFSLRPLFSYDSKGNVTDTRILTPNKIIASTGIVMRRKAGSSDTIESMAYHAGAEAISYASINKSSIEGIIVATWGSNDPNTPSYASKVQNELGLCNAKIALDINYACSGFPAALWIANSLANASTSEGNYLIIASEILTRHLDYRDINSTLFGDGSGAALLCPALGDTETPYNYVNFSGERLVCLTSHQKEKERVYKGILEAYFKSDPFDGREKYIFFDKNGKLRMPEGKKVFREAVNGMLESVEYLRNTLGWGEDAIIIPHQANGRIIDAISAKLDNEKVYKNMKYGNMSAATCAVALDDARKGGIVKEGSRVILTSFGAGLVNFAIAHQF